MRYLLKLITFLLIAILKIDARKPIICYWGTWSHYRQGNGKFQVSDIDGNLCTHLMYTFFGVSSTGDVVLLDPWLDTDLGNIQKTVALKQTYPHLKVLASVGGWNEGSAKFSSFARNPELRERFAQNCLNHVQKYGFDGIDIDWEYPGQRGGQSDDRENFTKLLKAVSDLFKPRNLLVVIAAASAQPSAEISYNIPEIIPYLDLINIMTYDYYGSWDTTTGMNAPLYSKPGSDEHFITFSVNASIKYWLSQGVPAEKLTMGIPLYVRTFTLASPSNNDVGAPIVGGGNAGPYTQTSGFLGYMEYCEIRSQPWTHKWDDAQKVPYAYHSNQWISYENKESVQLKIDFAKLHNIGGLMVWSIETDDKRGLCGDGSNFLLMMINKSWNNGNVSPTAKPTQSTSRPNVSTPQTTSRPTEKCTELGMKMNKKDCNEFVTCTVKGGEPIYRKCPEGLYYNEIVSACDWPHNVDCPKN